MAEVQTAVRSDLLLRFEARLRRRNLSPLTVRDYTNTARYFLRFHDGVPFEYLTADHIERFLDSRHLSPRSWCRHLSDLKAFFDFLRKHEKAIRHDPCADIERPQWQANYRSAPTREEFERIRAACQRPQEVLIVELLYFTGLRIAELLALTWEDVDVEKRRLFVRCGKGGKWRWAVFPERVAALLRPCSTTGYLLPSPRGPGPMRHQSVDWMLSKLGKRAGLRYRLSAHILRHGFARLMKTSGVPIEVTARLLGHADVRTTAAIYGRLDEDDLQQSYDQHIAG